MDNPELLSLYHKTPSVELRNRIVDENLGLARKAAHRFAKTSKLDYEELVQIGALGLIKAIERFNPLTGNKLSSFAMPYIRGEMLRYQRDKGTPGGFRISRTWSENRKKLQAGDRCGLGEVEYQRALQALEFRRPDSLDQRVENEDGDTVPRWEIADLRPSGTLGVRTIDDLLMSLQAPPSSSDYFNATKVCKHYGRRFHDWRKLSSTKSLIENFENNCKETTESRFSAVVTVRGRNAVAWVHKDLAAHFLQWVSPETQLAVIRMYSAAIEDFVA